MHQTVSDVALLPEETADSLAYLSRTIPHLLKDANPRLGSRFNLDVEELQELDSMSRKNRFLLEPFETVNAKMKLIYRKSFRGHNLTGVLNYSRLISRQQFCKGGAVLAQEVCDLSRCSKNPTGGCRISMYTVDGGHIGHVGKNAVVGMAINTAVALK